jgi:uncharacterized membrane protein YjgN (DUF898 family)
VDGDKPIGLAIGAIVLGVLVLLPALVVATFYVFANVYALITGSDFASATMNVGVFMTGLVVTVALFLLLMAGAVSFVGRALSPKNPKD